MLNEEWMTRDPLRGAKEGKASARALQAPPEWFARLTLSVLLLAAAAAPARAVDGDDLTEMTLESLMQVRVVGASRYE